MIQRVQTIWMLVTAALLGSMLILWAQLNIWFAILLILSVFVPIETIFLFRNRSRQTAHLIAEFVLIAGCAAFGVYYSWIAHTAWAYLPLFLLAALPTNWLALRGVLRDEMLIRDTDRIR